MSVAVSTMKAGVIVFPGSNCDRDAVVALRNSWGREPVVLHHKDTSLPPLDLIVLPGGFSYGDYLRCGVLAARSPIMHEVVRAARAGVSVLGICNGFQILTEVGLLPGALVRNRNLQFMSQLTSVEVANSESAFTRHFQRGEIIQLPVANANGSYTAPPDALEEIRDNNQIALRYTEDINGSADRIAGLLSRDGRVMGLMPHPERRCEGVLGGTDGLRFFSSFTGA